MAGEIEKFTYKGHELRVENRDGFAWSAAVNVARIINVKNVSQMVAPLDDDEKGISKVYTPGGEQEMIIISESGLYTVLIRSNKPEAREFRRWVTHEVLPSIRKTGRYDVEEHGGWITREQFATQGEIEERHDRRVQRVIDGFNVIEQRMSDEKRQNLADFLGDALIGMTKSRPDLNAKNPMLGVTGYLESRGVPRKLRTRWSGVFGERVAKLYRETYGHEPPQHMNSIGAAVRSSKRYPERDRFLFDRAYDEFVAEGRFPSNVKHLRLTSEGET